MLVLIPSEYVQTTVVDVVIGKTVVVVPVTIPLQLSVAVGAAILATLHCAFTVGNVAKLATGAVVSAIVTVWF